jgi:uncharacterized membrane protein
MAEEAQTQAQPAGTAQPAQQAQPAGTAQPTQTTAQPQEEKKTKWWVWLIVVLVALGILGGGAWYLFFR